jgi:hypothetical protein
MIDLFYSGSREWNVNLFGPVRYWTAVARLSANRLVQVEPMEEADPGGVRLIYQDLVTTY